ncbi:MAG TPA: YciI family protein [Phycisphaerae bacterium]|nr:YciI family protein [Phycisphaerae bacterium]
MPLFVMIGHDGPDGPHRRGQHRDQHVAYWTAMDEAGRVTLAGPIRDESNEASTGAVIVFEAADLKDAREIVERDPYVAGGVFESLTVAPFKHVFPKKP